ncbi:TVP38/TMEM64 family protein [Tychonema sp. BBK16]|uniref:TVP38/TMEM64 family protein n=1 Tax=Tychonema sp. BBK16 TaxID=2699888 RepID=UPI001F1D2047|nr:TVP38/TMEM64 family protein [Tychonema sp. BBK16]MCF6372312.1 TVP38/TMEM64 family protein [Tychonema sp. BBK16]
MNDSRSQIDENPPPSNKWKLIFLLVLVVALIVAAKFFNFQGILKNALDSIAHLGPWGPAAFILIYIVATVLFIPGSLLTLGSGVLFGVVGGTICVSIGSVLGATCAFLVGRYLTRDWVSQQIQGNAKFQAIDVAVASEGWKIVLLTRLSPIFPFNLLNYAFGVTQVSLRDYFFASWLGMIPGTVMYVYIGSLAGSLAALGSQGRSRTAAEWAFYGIGLVATIALTVYVTSFAKKALDEKISS